MILAITQRRGLTHEKTEAFWIEIQYKEIFEKLNILLFPVSTLTDLEKVVNICDGLVVTGSAIDIDPKHYNEKAIQEVDKNSKEIDELDFTLIKKFHEVKKPILGICRGVQSINVAFGGSLYQDINNHKLSKEERHEIKIDKNSFLYQYYQTEKVEVNSLHHQAVKKVADNFKATAISEDGIVEAIEYENIVGVQWHPEMLQDVNFFKAFVERFIKG